MCGRYMVTSAQEAMAVLFEAELGELGPEVARPNVSPTEPVPVVVSREGERFVVPMRWGLLPPFYRTASGGPLLINARSEGIAEKPAFREAVRARRCLLPADGFYEWQGEKGARVPFVVRPRAGGMIAFAGIWQDWKGPEGWISTCAIVTCPANATLAGVHERMPVVIAPEDFALWLGEAGHGAARLMVPAPEEALVAEPADAATREMLGRRAAPPPGLVALRA
ncbi:SOS response-associated peptidase [Amaricoccus sp.]|uniref:SOS response-associated peptidase n=1 Tax=Amaricoccus sp. TaxID=1872485 RepID=UPI00261937F0|nr:SOS response-associated peptidase [Amaricoccus sp.]HRO12371.1 SOS response-associated peptidase [Amaricoccus sp.]